MVRELPEKAEIQQLIRLSEVSRACLGDEAAALRQRLDFPARIRSSLSQHPASWLFGSLASGLAASLALRRKPTAIKKSRGMAATLLGLGLTAARPLLKVWLTNQVGRWLMEYSSSTTPSRPIARPLPKTHSL